jgi:hypothetical protein
MPFGQQHGLLDAQGPPAGYNGISKGVVGS